MPRIFADNTANILLPGIVINAVKSAALYLRLNIDFAFKQVIWVTASHFHTFFIKIRLIDNVF